MTGMARVILLLLATVPAWPGAALAVDVTAHEAQYRITLGTAANATQVGTARYRLAETCQSWQLERDIDIAFSVTTAWRFNVRSSLRGQQAQDSRFDYTLERLYNGDRTTRGGTVRPGGTAVGRADLRTPEGPQQLTLPPRTLLPTPALRQIISRLANGESEFTLKLWDSEIISDVFTVAVSLLPAEAIARPPIPAGAEALLRREGWPVYVAFHRNSDGAVAPPLFAITMLLLDNGVIARMTVPLGFVTLAVEPVSFKPLPRPPC